jgi:hypothetical protein
MLVYKCALSGDEGTYNHYHRSHLQHCPACRAQSASKKDEQPEHKAQPKQNLALLEKDGRYTIPHMH